MSKIGRKPIALGNVQVDIKGQEVHFKSSKSSGIYALPLELQANVEDKFLTLTPARKSRDINRVWGLHRALLANQLQGASTGFERKLIINGLGFKAVVSGSKIVFSLGFSHKIDFDLPKEVTAEVDKTGQQLTLKSINKEIVGQVASSIRALRPPEPYKGTGIKTAEEVIVRKAGKTKSS